MDLDTLAPLVTSVAHLQLAVITLMSILYLILNIAVCPTGQVSIGRCVNNQCPSGYTCTGTAPNNYCCGTASTVTCDEADSNGPCISGTCSTGYTCDTTQNLCCPDVTGESIGPCIGGECPDGLLIVTLNVFTKCFRLLLRQ